MLTKTASTLATFKESCPRNAPIKRVKSPDVEDNTVVLATLVRASAAFDKYCKRQGKGNNQNSPVIIRTNLRPLNLSILNRKFP